MKINTVIAGMLLLIAFAFSCNQPPSNQAASFLPRGQKADHLDRFESEIQAFELADQKKFPPKKSILFVGSSSIRMWESLKSDFSEFQVINRGFGGSTVPEVNYYADRIIWKYDPSVIVFYCGENDINDGEHPAVVFQNFKKFIGEIEKRLPGTKVVFISAKPSPSRWNRWKDFQLYNNMVLQFAENRPNLYFLDISTVMIGNDGLPDKSLFIEDMLHINKKGYAKWTAELNPLLKNIQTSEAIK